MSQSWPCLTSTVTSQFYRAIKLHREAYALGRWGILKHAVTKAPLFTLCTFIVAECTQVGSLHKIPQVSSQLLMASSVDVHFCTWQQRELYQDARCVCTQMRMSAGSCLCQRTTSGVSRQTPPILVCWCCCLFGEGMVSCWLGTH